MATSRSTFFWGETGEEAAWTGEVVVVGESCPKHLPVRLGGTGKLEPKRVQGAAAGGRLTAKLHDDAPVLFSGFIQIAYLEYSEIAGVGSKLAEWLLH